jgi:bacillithiol synthase
MTDVRIITEPIGGSPLSRLLQRGEAPAEWLAAPPVSTDDWRARAEARRQERDWRARWDALLPALDPAGAAATRLARVRDAGGIVVTTGQQPGLFGGPIYTWSKAVSALALADELEAATGIPAIAIFWAATDDADFAEAAATSVARSGGLDVLRATLEPPAGTPMSVAALGDLADALRRLRDASGSAADPRPLAAVSEAYGSPDRSHGDAFVSLLRTMLAPLGVPVLDASHPAVRAESDPMVRSSLRLAAEVEQALAARAKAIRALGHEPQVDDVPGLALAFVRDGGAKRRVTVAEARTARGSLTPNVLLRPIVEHALLPTVAYMAGPGELAYFAQVGAVADALGVAIPLAVPRWSCTLIEPHVQALLDRMGVTLGDLDQPDALEGRIARAAMSDTSARALESLRREIARVPEALSAECGPLGLDAALVGARQALAHRVDRLERRLVAAIKRRETAKMRDVATLRAALRPRGNRQERLLNAIPLLSRHGCGLLVEMSRAARTHATSLVAPGRPASAAGVIE